jgi:lincosamide nucleotidyltransferase B/F
MPTTHALLNRLDAIGHSLEKSGHALALIGLGSVGMDTERLDSYSDLDFFVIVEGGFKPRYIENLDWLTALCPIVFHFRNTPDGHKVLYQDGIFCEFAVFEQPELQTIPFGEGRIIWKQPQINETICKPILSGSPHPSSDAQWLIGEALTNLYVGLGRFRRGEKLSAAQFVQNHAVDRILELAKQIEREEDIPRDVFANERRFEQRFPKIAQELPLFVQGYERSIESALALLGFLERHFDINPAIAAAIRELGNADE